MAAPLLLQRADTLAEPRLESVRGSGEAAGSLAHRLDLSRELERLPHESKTIDSQERAHGAVRRSLVTVDEGLRLSDADRQQSGLPNEVGTVVVGRHPRARDSGFKRALVPQRRGVAHAFHDEPVDSDHIRQAQVTRFRRKRHPTVQCPPRYL